MYLPVLPFADRVLAEKSHEESSIRGQENECHDADLHWQKWEQANAHSMPASRLPIEKGLGEPTILLR